jgi:Flp pilus assembly pilin Flp
MSNLMVRTASRSQVELHAAAARLADYLHKAVARVQREQTGQDMVEYAGVLLVVSVIIAAVAATGVWSPLATGITNLIKEVLSGTSGKGGGG